MVLVGCRLRFGPARNADDKVAGSKFPLLVLRRAVATLAASNPIAM